jgi:hypothetical protein
MKNPYGIRDGQILLVDAVDRGLACNCTCPGCGHPLEAHKGDIRSPYFSHYRGSECGVGYETALHLMAKEVLAETKQLLLPPLRVYPEKAIYRAGTKAHPIWLVKKGMQFTFDKVLVEAVLGEIIPDVILEIRSRRLLVEIKVTHGVDKEKLAKIESLDISAIEFNFSLADRAVTKADLQRALVEKYMPLGFGGGYWIYHTNLRETRERANREYLEQNPPPPPPPPEPPKLQQGVLF